MNESRDDYQALVQFLYRAPIGLAEIDRDGTVAMVNPMAARLLLPLSPDGSLDNLFVVLQALAPDLAGRVAADADAASAGGEPSADDEGIVIDGRRLVLPERAPRRDADPQVLGLSVLRLDATRWMAVVTDASADVEREQQRLHRASRTDALTHMPNRAAAREQVAAALEQLRSDPDQRFALVHLNCDRFQRINDTVGRAGGDTVLAQMAERLRGALRGSDGVLQSAARVGGDEFVALLRDLRSAGDAERVAQRLLAAMSEPYFCEGQTLHCAVSAGVLLHADPARDADGALQDAALATAEAKRLGGARHVMFDRGMQERAWRRGVIEAELRGSIAANELFVVYQPVVELASGRIASAEALVRWRHPTRGIVPPVEFIPVAEESGFIAELGAFVLETACRDFAGWRKTLARAPSTIAVNLSRAQLTQPELAAQVQRALSSAGIQAGQLQLEVTESLAAQDQDVQRRLHELKQLGVTLALDDFGTGYSSLASLHELPVDTVKIDRSFVSRTETSAHHRVLVDATVRVAHSLGMSTVAEGIETEGQARLLHAVACDKGQGYLYARPLDEAAMRRWLVDAPMQWAAAA